MSNSSEDSKFQILRRALDSILDSGREKHPFLLTFDERVFLVFMKADRDNIDILEKGFPAYYHVWRSYKNAKYFMST